VRLLTTRGSVQWRVTVSPDAEAQPTGRADPNDHLRRIEVLPPSRRRVELNSFGLE
jgi:hypothetical protein